MVAFLDLRAEPVACDGREAQLDLAAFERVRELEPRTREYVQRRVVVAEDVGDEARDAGLGCAEGELLEQSRPDPACLLLVRDCERDLGRRGVAQAHVARDRDDPFVAAVAERADQRAALVPVRSKVVVHELRRDRTRAVETEVAAALGERAEERDQRRLVLGRRRPQAQRSAVAEDHVDGVVLGSAGQGHGHTLTARCAPVIGDDPERSCGFPVARRYFVATSCSGSVSAAGACFSGGTARTGQDVTWSSRWVTLPSSRPAIELRPRVPTTITSAPAPSATSAIA